MTRSLRLPGACALALALVTAALPARAQQELDSSSVKINRVVLYKHGVGYFERSGKVDGDAVIRFQFKESEMKDLLKSFYALDLGGGKITTIAYDAKDPLQKRMADIQIDIPANNALSGLLVQLQGVRIEIKVAGEKLTGRILGLEPVSETVENKQVVTRNILIFQKEDGSIEHLTLFDVQGLRVLDEGIARDMTRLMENLQTSRYGERKKMSVRTVGTGAREIRCGYILETPIWKTSYRMILDSGKDPLLQGWAIVDNTTEEDWDNVNLTLIGGSPISFVMDLYTPFYPLRPVMGIASQAAVSFRPQESAGEDVELALKDAEENEGGAMDKAKGGRELRKSAEKLRRAAPGAPVAAGGGGSAGYAMSKLMTDSIETAAKGTQVGELFQYEIKQPVNIQKGSSGLVPILMETVKADRVLYFSQALHPTHPMHALYLNNTTGLTLESGPMTIFEGNTCAGESLLTHSLKTQNHEILAYSVETACTVDRAMASRDEEVHQYSLANGILTLHNYRLLETKYRIFNQGDGATLYLDHPKQPGFALKDPAKPEEDLPALTRWKIAVEARKNQDFAVLEQMEVVNQVQLLGLRTEDFQFYLSARYLKDATRKFFEEIAGTSAKLTEHRGSLQRLNEERGQLANDQNQVRSNLSALGHSAQEEKLRQTFLTRMEEMDSRNQAIRGEEDGLRKEVQRLERDLREKVQAYKEQ